MTRTQIGYDPAGGTNSIVVEVRPRMQGFRRLVLDSAVHSASAPSKQPGAIDEYPSRAAHARAHRLRSEIRRRDRRRARTGRDPIQPATYPKRRPLLPLAMRQQVAQLAVTSGWLVQAIERPVVPLREAMRDFVESMQHAIPHRFIAGATPERTIYDDVAAYRRFVEGDAAGSARARRDQVLAGPYITVDELRRQMAEAEQHAEHYRQAFERIQARAAVGWPRRYAAGGFVSPPRDQDDDTVLAQFSPGELWVVPAERRTASPCDITHHDHYLGEGALERDDTSSVHSTDSSGTGAVWSDLMARIDDLVDETEQP